MKQKKKMHYFINGFTTWKEFQRAFFRGLFYADVFIFFLAMQIISGANMFSSHIIIDEIDKIYHPLTALFGFNIIVPSCCMI